ncbi:MAG TPA: hypothetical protein VF746_23590 [Longimicrobium sp.]
MLIPDLAEAEFDLLFADNHADPAFRALVLDEITGPSAATSRLEALAILEGR